MTKELGLSDEERASRKRFSRRVRVRASVAVCWSVFTEHDRIGEFTDTPMRVITPGQPDRNGLGCIRRLGTLGHTVDEVVNYWRPQELFGYHVIDSPIVSHHQGIVRFWPLADGGTEWLYDMQLIPAPAALAAQPNLVQLFTDGFQAYMASAECECERRAAEFEVPAEPISVGIHGGQLQRGS
jgi:hypothetical protein